MSSKTKVPDSTQPERRSFMTRFGAVVVGGIVAIFPFAAGLGVLFDPLRRKKRGDGEPAETDGAKFLPVCPLDQLPADGVPRRFSLTADVVDAWSNRLGQSIGAVYLTRAEGAADELAGITAFTTTCPHLGCAVDFNLEQKQYECPCHKSGFALDGKQIFGPSRRGLDSLEAKVSPHAGQPTIWVRYQRFRMGVPAKEPIA